MFDGFTDHAIDYCDQPYGSIRGRLIRLFIVAYIVITVVFVTESHFRRNGIELEAKIESVGETRLPGKRCEMGMLVRYHFRDPATGQPRMNTIAVPKQLAPSGPTALIEYIPGEFPTSRLKVQQRPVIFGVYFWLNSTLLLAVIGFIGYMVWETHRPIPRSAERRVVLKRKP